MTRQRLYEIIPGALVWTTLVASIVLSFLRPLWMVYVVLLFDLYWLLRILYFIPFLLISWHRYRRAGRRDWQAELMALPDQAAIKQLVFLPTYKESWPVVRETFHALLRSRFPVQRMVIVLAGEERDEVDFRAMAQRIQEEFAGAFLGFFVTVHPANLPGEIAGKGSNLHWSAEQLLPEFQRLGLEPETTIVSAFDVDTLIHPQYFSCLALTFLTVPEPTHSSYQPVAVYNNNLWQSPAVVRIAMFGTTFWLMTELARAEGMMTFSSHSMSLRMLMDVGFWQVDVVSEDSRIFLQGLAEYHGAYRVTPIYLPVSMDTVMAGHYGRALKALYKQLRRWAWGVENFPYMMEKFWSDRQMPLVSKLSWTFKQLEGMYTWATAPFLISILGYLPFVFAPASLQNSALLQNTPFTLQWLMRLAMIGVFISAALALSLLPPRPPQLSRGYAYGIMLLQWLLLPLTFILFGALPALDAQTRFMLGQRLGFQVSPKRRLDK